MIRVSNLSFGYHRPLSAPLSFELEEGEILLINGSNGSGKSTLMKTLQGNLRPLSGIIESSFKLGSLSQDVPTTLNLSLTMKELAALFQIPKQIEHTLLSDIPTHMRWEELSGGMRQRAMLAMGLAKGAEALILDEPANHLDQEGVEKLSLLLKDLLSTRVIKALIVVSHISLFEGARNIKRLAI